MRSNLVRAIKKELPTGDSSNKNGVLSTMQLKDGLRMWEVTYLVALREFKEKDIDDVLEKVVELLEEFEDVMPFGLPKTLPPKRVADHKIELLSGATPPAWVPYRMSPKELVELQKQFTELLEAGFIQPSK